MAVFGAPVAHGNDQRVGAFTTEHDAVAGAVPFPVSVISPMVSAYMPFDDRAGPPRP